MKRTTRFVSVFLMAAAILATLKPAQAVDPWVDLGLFGGQVYSIAIDPVSTNKMFAGAYYGGGLFVTTDGGANWKAVLTGDEDGEFDGEATFRNTAVYAVKIAPSNRNVVWAAHNYWVEKSTDGGATWTHILNSTMQRDCSGCPGDGSEQFRFCRTLAIHPTNPQIVYVGTSGPNGGYSNGAVYKTTDGGSSWTKMGSFDYSVLDIEIDKQNNNIVWVITSSEGYGGFSSSLYRSVNGGTSWPKITTLATAFYDLVVRPDVANEVYVASYAALIKYYYTGTAWASAVAKAGATNVRALAVSPQSPYKLYAAWGATKVSVTDNWGNSWSDHTPNKQFISLVVHPTNSTRVFGGELQLGVWRGDFPAGATASWTERNQGINAVLVNDIDIDPHDATHLLAATSIGVYEKRGSGAWGRTSSFTYSAAYSVAFDPSDEDGSTYFAGSEGGFHWATYIFGVGYVWSSSGTTFGSAKVVDIALGSNVVPGSSGTVFIATRSGVSGKIYKSTNGGSTFAQKLSSATFNFNKVTFLPSAPNVVYAGGGNYFAPKVLGNLYKSINGGDSWSPVLANEIVNSIMIDPDNSSVVYSGCGYSGGTTVPVYKTGDGGTTWAKACLGIPGARVRYGIWGIGANDIFVLGHHGSVVKGGEDDTKLLHYDGASWTEQDTGVATYFRGVGGLSSSQVMAVGDWGATARYNGSIWSKVSTGTEEDLFGVWGVPSGLDAGDYFAVGKGGTILRYERRWSPMVSGTLKDLYGVWGYVDGSSLPNVFAVGALGTILRYSPQTNSWTLMNSGGIAEQLNAVWGSSGTNVYAVGDAWRDGSQLKYNILRYALTLPLGMKWSRVTTPAVPVGKTGKLRAIWGRSSTSIYAVGDDGVILKYSGRSWSAMSSGTTADLYGVWGYPSGTSAEVVYAVGTYGTLIKYTTESGAWSAVGGITESGPPWNPVTDIKSKIEGSARTLYAGTSRQGIYASPNGGESWTSLGAPPYDVHAISLGSVVVATQGGSYGAGWGWMWGQVFDEKTGLPIDSALVQTDAGYWHATDAKGFYHMTMPPGAYRVTGSAAGYAPEETASPVQVLSGGATQVTFHLLDPIITVRIDGQELKAQGGIFIGAGGRIRPTAGVGYIIDAAGDLMVQYDTGWVTLGFEPIEGYGVQNVLVNGQTQGSLRSYKLSNVTVPKTIEALFRAVYPGDWDADCDVDGLDLAALAKGGTGIDLDAFAAHFGSVGCP